MALEPDIDRLYQLPRSAFVAERNALARRAGADAARVKALEKPQAAAWAVNQLYWRDRRLYDAVVKATTRMRAAHARALAGKEVDIALAEAARAKAVRDAVDRAETLLSQAGDAASDATLQAIRDTLGALPAADAAGESGRPGRLARPVSSAVGFEALADLLRGAAIAPAVKANVIKMPRAKAPTPGDRRDDARRARAEAAAARHALDEQQRRIESSLAPARTALAALDEDRRDLRAQLEKIEASAARTSAEIDRLERELSAVARERALLDERGRS